MHDTILIPGYGSERASAYDESSVLDKGDREFHRNMLKDVLAFLPSRPTSFLDLGCGTGYFAEIFYEAFPGISGTLLDGSADMISFAKSRYQGRPVKAGYMVERFQDIRFEELPHRYDLVFSSLAVHHLEDAQKWMLFRKIYDNLSPQGVFILYDIFRVQDNRSQDLLEFMACKDMQRRLMQELETDVEIEELSMPHIIANDRRIRGEEHDLEADLPEMLCQLELAGFRSVTVFLQEARFAGIIGFKD